MDGACSTHGEKFIQGFCGKNWRKQTTRKTYTRRWEDNIKPDIKDIERKVADWIHPAHEDCQWQVAANTVMNFTVP